MTEYATKQDFQDLKSEILEQRKVTQDLITVVATNNQEVISFMKFQEKLNDDLRKIIKEANEDTCGKLKELKEDMTVRLNKHSERLEENQKEHAEFKTKDATLKEQVKSESKLVAYIISGIAGFIAIILSIVLTQGLKAETPKSETQKKMEATHSTYRY